MLILKPPRLQEGTSVSTLTLGNAMPIAQHFENTVHPQRTLDLEYQYIAVMTSKFNLNVDLVGVLYRSMIGLGKYKLNLDQPLFLSLKTGWVHIFPKVCLEPWIKCRNSKKQWYEFCSIGYNYPFLFAELHLSEVKNASYSCI